MLVPCVNSRLRLQQKTSKFSPSQCIWRLGIVCHTWYTSYSLRPTRALSISRIYMYICTLPTTSAGSLSQTHPYPAYLGLYTCTHTDAQCLLSGQHHIALCPQENLQPTAFLRMGTRVHDGKPSLFIVITTIYYTKLDHFVFGTFEVQRLHPLKMPPPTRHRVSLPHWRSLVEVAGPTPPVAASATSPMPQVRSTWQLNQTIFEVNWKEIGIIKILRASC